MEIGLITYFCSNAGASAIYAALSKMLGPLSDFTNLVDEMGATSAGVLYTKIQLKGPEMNDYRLAVLD